MNANEENVSIKKVFKKRKVNLKNLDDFEKDLVSGDFFSSITSGNALTPLEVFRNTISKNREVLIGQLKAYSDSGTLSMKQLCVAINKKYKFNISEDTLGKWIKEDAPKANRVSALPNKCLVIIFDDDEDIVDLTENNIFLNASIKIKLRDFLGIPESSKGNKKPVVEVENNFLDIDTSKIGG